MLIDHPRCINIFLQCNNYFFNKFELLSELYPHKKIKITLDK